MLEDTVSRGIVTRLSTSGTRISFKVRLVLVAVEQRAIATYELQSQIPIMGFCI